MDLAIINMISDLKFYYNLMYYLINTQMNNNLKIILTTDIVRYASMVTSADRGAVLEVKPTK